MKLDAVRGFTLLLAVTVLLYCDPSVSLVHARDDNSQHRRTSSSSCPQSVKRWDLPFGAVLRGREAVGYHNDGQLSTRHLTDAAAVVTDSYTYDAFGVTLAQTGSTANAYLYTGEQLDPNVGFYYLRARYLNHTSGRFASLDPFPGLDQEPSSLHKYLYANGDAVNRSDPSGLTTLIEVVAVLLIISILLYGCGSGAPSTTTIKVYYKEVGQYGGPIYAPDVVHKRVEEMFRKVLGKDATRVKWIWINGSASKLGRDGSTINIQLDDTLQKRGAIASSPPTSWRTNFSREGFDTDFPHIPLSFTAN